MDSQFLIKFRKDLLTIFDPETTNIFIWLNTLDYIIEVLNIIDFDKSTFLLDHVQSSVLTVVMNEFCPQDPFFGPYEDISYSLESHYGMACDRHDAAYYRFLCRDQLPYESAQHYFNVLKDLLKRSFPLTNTEENLMFRFMEGLEDKNTRSLLLNHPDDMTLTLEIAINIAKIKESANNEFKIPFNEDS